MSSDECKKNKDENYNKKQNNILEYLSGEEEHFEDISANFLFLAQVISRFIRVPKWIIKGQIIQLIGIIFLLKASIIKLNKSCFSKDYKVISLNYLRVIVAILYLIASTMAVYVVIKDYILGLKDIPEEV